MEYMEFKRKLLKKFNSETGDCFIKEEDLFINYKNRSCAIELLKIFEEVNKEGHVDVDGTYMNIMNVIKDNYDVVTRDVDWKSSYPVIRPIGFCPEQELFHRELFLDLELYLVEDLGNGMIKFIREDEVELDEYAINKCFENLNKVEAYLVPLDHKAGIYYSEPADGFAASRIATEKMQKQIASILGKSYILLISDDSGFIVCKNNVKNYRFLKHLTEEKDFEYRISKRIYKCTEGTRFNYTDHRDIFRIIK